MMEKTDGLILPAGVAILFVIAQKGCKKATGPMKFPLKVSGQLLKRRTPPF